MQVSADRDKDADPVRRRPRDGDRDGLAQEQVDAATFHSAIALARD
jgi:hypothetical protein